MTEYFHKFKLNYMMPIVAKIVLAILAIVMVPLYIKYWGVELYKEYVLILSLMAYANIITNPISNFMLKLKSQIKKIKFYEIASINLVLVILIVLPLVSLYLYSSYDKKYIFLFCITIILLISLNGLLRTIFISINKVNHFSLFEIIFSILKLPFSFYIAYVLSSSEQEHFIVFFILYIVLFLCENLVVFLYLKINKLLETKLQFLYVVQKLLLSKNSFLYFVLVVVLEVIIGTFDRLYLIKYATSDDFLVFTIALTIVSSFYLVVNPINSQALPLFFEQNLIEKKINLIKIYYKEILFVLTPMIIIYALVGNFLIDFWLKNTVNNQLKEYIYLISLFLIIGVLFNSLSGPLQNFLVSHAKEKCLFYNNISFCFFLIFSLILSYTLGNIFYFALAFSISYFIKFIIYRRSVLVVSK